MNPDRVPPSSPTLDTHLDLTLIERVRRDLPDDDLTWRRFAVPVNRDHSPIPPPPPPPAFRATPLPPRPPPRRTATWVPLASLMLALGALGAAASILGGAIVSGVTGLLPPAHAGTLAAGAMLVGFGAGLVAVLAWVHLPRRRD